MTSITPNQIQQSGEPSGQSYDNMNTNDYIVSSNENVTNQIGHEDNTIQTLPDDKKEELYKKYETFDSQGNANVPYSNEYDIKQSDDEELINKESESNYRIKIPQVKTNSTIKKFSFNNNNSNINKNIPQVGKYVSTPILNNKPIDNIIDDNNNKDNSTINALEQQISYLKNQIDLLNRELTAEKSKNSLLTQKNIELEKNINIPINANDQTIIADIMSFLNIQSKEEILPKLEELINHIKSLESKTNSNQSSNKKPSSNDKLKDELIDKLKSLYIALTGTEQNDDIDIKTIWRWIKHLINIVRDLAQEKEKNYQVYQELNEANAYKDFCYEIMNEFNIDSIENFKNFINDVLGSIQQNQSEVVDNNNNDDKQNFY